MGAGRQHAQAMPMRDLAHGPAQHAQLAFGGSGVVMHAGLHFDLGLQHLAAEALAQCFPAVGEEASRHVPQAPAVATDQEVLFFQAEGIRMRGAFLCHARVIAPAR